jgi:type IV pilus assembly protein PilY1
MRMRTLICALATTLLCTLYASAGLAQTTEDFTSTATSNPWYYSGGACLTASTSAGTGTEFTVTSAGTAGIIPGCTAIQSNSDAYNGETLVGGNSGTLPDLPSTGSCPANSVCGGALRFTNGCIGGNCSSGGYNQFGAIISGNTFSSAAGVQVTFKTVTYRGNSGGAAGDGADGISFFLLNAQLTSTSGVVTNNVPNIGQYGGSLAYSCSNSNGIYGYGGAVGGYIGLGIDEFGNFLNGTNNTLGETGSTNNGGDNTASGGGYQPNRIGLRGAGNVAWSWLHANYPTYYPTMGIYVEAAAVQNTCSTGTLWDYSNPSAPVNTNTAVLDYAAIPNAYKVLSGVTIANEYASGGLTRGNATPILYKLKITSSGLLSLNYSFNGGAWQSVLTNQSITASNGTLPANLRFGFAGSTGGDTNIHEVLCFKAAAADTSASSATSNQTQSSRVTSSTQAYFSFYDPNNWTGRLTANAVTSDAVGNLTIASQATWDASCVLTGVAAAPATCPTTGAVGPTAAEAPSVRQIMTWNSTLNNGVPVGGIPFEFANLSAAQQAALNLGDSSSTANRLNFLRGDRSNEVNTAGVGLFRDRDYVLGDIVDSSPVAVGQPVLPYAITWQDRLHTTATMPENGSSAQTYSQFIAAEQTRQNVVYVGANDGMVHGFSAGAFDSTNTYQNATNNGKEILAYVPGSILLSAASSTSWGTTTPCSSTVTTQSTVQNIHGESPAIGTTPACFNPTLDYSNTQYGHNFFVDATPGTGDLFYGNRWHTWLVGGLGAGGAAIYALDVTTPTSTNFAETNASNVVIGEWTAASINTSCASGSTCGNNLGNTYGTPLIRRLHNGSWAVIFGNGFGSSTGDAGVYIMTVAAATGAKTFYYLSTGKTGTGDGIAYVSSVDLDGDHVADYLYAGDLLGNVWRFDLTSTNPGTWAVTPGPMFAAGATHPITSNVVVAAVAGTSGNQVMVAFGTGQKTPLTNISSASYATAQQYLYAFWDWNYSAWNALAPGAQFATLTTAPSNTTGLTSPYTLTPSNLTAQTLAIQSTGTVDLTSQTICWQGSTACASGNTSFGWYAALPGTQEQIIYNPLLVGTALSVNSIIPASNSLLSCSTSLDSGYTYAITLASGTVAQPATGNTSFFVNTTQTSTNSSGVTTTTTTTNTDANAAGVLSNATGQSTIMTTSTNSSSASIAGMGTGSTVSCTLAGQCTNLPGNLVTTPSPFAGVTGCSAGDTYLVYQTTSGTASYYRVAPKCPLTGNRVTRSQVR